MIIRKVNVILEIRLYFLLFYIQNMKIRRPALYYDIHFSFSDFMLQNLWETNGFTQKLAIFKNLQFLFHFL